MPETRNQLKVKSRSFIASFFPTKQMRYAPDRQDSRPTQWELLAAPA